MPKKKRIMKCGHAEQGYIGTKDNPVCICCLGITKGADEVDEAATESVGSEDRMALCAYGCGSKTKSGTDLAFFQHKPNSPTDEYYCGCWGWD